MPLRSSTTRAEIAPIVTTLEAQLMHLDRLGIQMAAAHLDAAICRLRIDYLTQPDQPDISP